MGSTEIKFVVQDGAQWVEPYYFDYTGFTKKRWINRSLIEVLKQEFPFRAKGYYEECLRDCRITLNGKKVEDGDIALKDGDLVVHRVHRHEAPVIDYGGRIAIVANTDDYLAVDKPATIPVHPCGRYNHNSLTRLLERQTGLSNLRPPYRLDQLASGLVILAKTKPFARLLSEAVKDHTKTAKQYVVEVVGRVPWQKCHVTAAIRPRVDMVRFSHVECHPDGRSARTELTKISYSPASDTTVLTADIFSGRTHQIRVHCEHAGYPIVNDPVYDRRGVVGSFGLAYEGLAASDTGLRSDKEAEEDEEEKEEEKTGGRKRAASQLSFNSIVGTSQASATTGSGGAAGGSAVGGGPEGASAFPAHLTRMATQHRPLFGGGAGPGADADSSAAVPRPAWFDPACPDCTAPDAQLLGLMNEGLHLHALRYSFLVPALSLETEMPRWARKGQGTHGMQSSDSVEKCPSSEES